MHLSFAKDDDVVETLSTCRAYKALSIWILLGTLRCRKHLLDAHAIDPIAKLLAVDAVAVADHVPGRGLLGEGLDDLLGSPGRAWELRDVEMENAASVM